MTGGHPEDVDCATIGKSYDGISNSSRNVVISNSQINRLHLNNYCN